MADREKPREQKPGLGRLSMFKYEPDLDDVEGILTGRIEPRVGDFVKSSPPEVKDDRR